MQIAPHYSSMNLFYSDKTAQAALSKYISAYATLLQVLAKYAPVLSTRFNQAYRVILQALLRLDIIFIETPVSWKAILTPLHPLQLWRYYEILQKTGPQLGPEEQKQLTQALPMLPHLLHFVVGSGGPFAQLNHPIILPQAGSLETLAIYENQTLRYVGSDGVEFLTDLINRWLMFAPYSRPQMRVALINVPYLPDALRAVVRFMRSQRQTSVVIDAYDTRKHPVLEHLAEMSFESTDSDTAEMLLTEKLRLRLYSCDSLQDVTTQLTQNPVHIVYSFDQSEYHLATTTRQSHLFVSPLVVTYEYKYDPIVKKGNIAPSSDADSGLFADYHAVINQAIDMQQGQRIQTRISSNSDMDSLNSG